MSLRLTDIGPIGSLALFTLLGCSSDPAPAPGSGGSGGSAPSGGNAGMSSGGSAGGSSTGGAGSSAGGGGSGGSSAGGGGSSAGGGGSSAGGGGSSAGGGGSGGSAGSGGGASKTTFFVSSDTSKTGNLGGLAGADTRCQTLATAAGITGHTFKAYLSTSTVNAKDCIGTGPWYNANGELLAMNLADLHNAAMVKGDHVLFVTEKKEVINGQWNNVSNMGQMPPPNEHDILTGTKADGTVSANAHCMDWTSASAQAMRQVGHSDGMGPGMATTGTYSSWVEAHIVSGCDKTEPGGGAGRIYCFASD